MTATEEVLHLQTLGTTGLRHSSAVNSKPHLDAGKPFALIAFLACCPQRTARRDGLLDLIWADLDRVAGRHALRQTLWYVRRRVPAPLLEARGDSISISVPLHVDRDDLLTAAAQGDLEKVVAIYTGDFLPEFAFPGGAEFERWAEIERAHLRSIFSRSAEALVRRWLSSGRFRDAQRLARRLREMDNSSESTWRLVLEATMSSGDAIGAAVEADALERMLHEEGQEPEPSTTALIRIVRKEAPPGAAPSESRFILPFVGRQVEFSTILEAWEQSRIGKPRHVHVSAPAGLGKTRLIDDVRTRLRSLRARVIHVRASLGQRDVPYALTSELAAQAAALPGARGVSTGSAAALIALNPTLTSSFNTHQDDSHGSEALRRRTLALRELLDVVSQEHPIALLVDDLHWGDEASHSVLRSLIESLGSTRLLVVTTGRLVPRGRISTDITTELLLKALTQDHVAELLTCLGELPSEPWARDLSSVLLEATGGSPLLLLETVRLLLDRDVLALHEGGWQCRSAEQLADLVAGGSAVTRRLRSLNANEADVLTLLAVAGAPTPPGVIQDGLAISTEPLGATLGFLEQKGLVARIGDEWTVSHDEIARVASDAIRPDERRAILSRLGRAVASAAGTDPQAVRRAFAYARDGGDTGLASRLFVQLATFERSRGNRRSNHELVADLLGVTEPRYAQTLVASLPLTQRLGLYSPKRIGALAGIAVVAVLSLVVYLARPPADLELAVFISSGDTVQNGYRVGIRYDDWVAGRPIDVSMRRRAWRISGTALNSIAMMPGTNRWYYYRSVPDDGVQDVFESDGRGRERRLTTAPGDDYQPAGSPDGWHLVLPTARWDPEDHLDIALIDVRTDSVIRLTSGTHSEFSPAWNPAGTHLAFVRFYFDRPEDATEICIMPRTGAHERCWKPGNTTRSTELLGWVDADRVMFRSWSGATDTLRLISTTTGGVTGIGRLTGSGAALSPDGGILVCQCDLDPYPSGTWLAVPTWTPERARPIRFGRTAEQPPRFAWTTTGTRPFLAELHLATGNGPPIAGVPHQLTALAVSSADQETSVPEVSWSLVDSSIASIDSSALLTARDTGVVRIRMVAGSVVDTATVVVRHVNEETLVRWQWEGPISSQWTVYGTPAPSTIPDTAFGTVLTGNGDGRHDSGVQSRASVSARDGVALDLVTSTPISRTQHQLLNAQLTEAASLDHLLAQTLASGDLPPQAYPCRFTFPGGDEGVHRTDSVTVSSEPAREVLRAPAPSWMASGRWYRVRLQLFPDGRCGLAINGIPILVTRTPTPVRDVQVSIGGATKDTRILVGPMTLTRGVPRDIDWSTVPPGRWSEQTGQSRMPRPLPLSALVKR